MRVRRAVVTGGSGFLGSHLCHRLLQDGYEVICLDDFCTGNSINVEHLLEDRRFRLVRAEDRVAALGGTLTAEVAGSTLLVEGEVPCAS